MMSSALWSLLKNRFPDSPVQVEIGELREPAAVARLHFHQAQRIGNEVIRS